MAVDTTESTGPASGMTVSEEVMIEMRDVHKWYGEFHVLKAINLTVKKGERIVICGPSGSGKSTLIRCLNRLEEHQRGEIVVEGIELTGDLKHIEQIRREVGMVFQHFNLFPHLTVLENLTLAPIWVRKTPKAEAEEAAMHYLERVKIPEQAAEVSGSAIGRAAAARRDCPLAVHDPEDHAVRRADLGARSRDDRGGLGCDDRARQIGHDDDLRHARNGFRAHGRQPGDLHG